MFVEFTAVTGLRLSEAINSWNLIDADDYYDQKLQALEHFKFKNVFLRRTKKVFISFVPEDLIERIREMHGRVKLTETIVKKRIQRRGLRMRFGDLREYWATFMTKWLNPAEIDFLQGRVSASVFMRHYFNPALISDLKERTLKGIDRLRRTLF